MSPFKIIIITCLLAAPAIAQAGDLRPADIQPISAEEPARPGADAAISLTPEVIVELRRLLYSFGFPIRGFDAEMGPDLVRSISLLQKISGKRDNAPLTTSQLEDLRKKSPPSQWGAISLTGTGGHVGVARRPTRFDAESEANSECSTRAHKRCHAVTVSGTQCVSLTHSIHNDGFRPVVQNFVVYGDDPATIRRTALAECKAKAQLRDNCEIRRIVCADGRN